MFSKRMSRRKFMTLSAMAAASYSLDWTRIASCEAALGPKEAYPVVVIGAGLGGLCCGAYLARQGFPVTVVEQHSVPGGYATSFDRDRGRFSFEVSLHGTSLRSSVPARILQDIGVWDKIDLVDLPEIYRLKTPRVDLSVPPQDPAEYIRRVAAYFPEEAEGIQGFVEEMMGLSDEVTAYDQSSDFSKTFFKVLFPLLYRRMWRVRHQSLDDMLNEHVKDPAVREILAGLWGYYGLPPSQLSGFFYANATGGYLKNGSFYIRQRSQDLSLAMAAAVEEAGGEVICDAPVERILTDKGIAAGVVLADGRELPARSVVSNASALATFERMLPPRAVPEEFLGRLRSFQPSISTFIVWLGLNREIKDHVSAYSTHVATGRGIEADYRAAVEGDIEKVGFSVTTYDKLFPGYSTPGTSTVMLLCLSGYGPWERFETDYRAGRKSAYNEEKQRWADILVRRAAKEVIPGLTEMIAVREAATPLTNWRYTGNTRGAIYGFEQSMDNAYMNRIDNRTPVRGLYLTGAWGNPGGGFEGALRSGAKTFALLLDDWRSG